MDINNVIKHIVKRGDDGGFRPKPCEEATNTMPGTEERIRVYMARIERGEELFHERDRLGVDPEEGRPSFSQDHKIVLRGKHGSLA